MLKVFTEGKDKVFIERFIEIRFEKKNEIDFQVIPTNGWTNLKLAAPKIIEFTDAHNDICIVFDADFPTNEGGFKKRLDEINAIRKEQQLNFEVFLFPNNIDDGDFESILEAIANELRKGVFECFTDYERCVKQKLSEKEMTFHLPARKSRIFAYAETLPFSSKEWEKFGKRGNFLFENTDYWNINSEALKPLFDFLAPKLK